MARLTPGLARPAQPLSRLRPQNQGKEIAMFQLPDRHKRNIIMGTTAWLPAPLRVRARYSLLWSLQGAQTRKADAVIIVHPKSGGTWLRTLLFRLFQRKYGAPPRRVIKTDELKQFNPALPRFVISNGHYSYEAAVRDRLAQEGTHGKRLILLARNPCDIAVSWYLQFTRRISSAKRELILHEMRQPIDYKTISLWEFVMHQELGLPALIEYHNQWMEFFAEHENGLIVRYEDLHSAPLATLRCLTTYLGEEADDEELQEAVQFASFDNLRKLEEANYFRTPGLRLKDRNDPNTYKVRRGKVGGFRDYFEPAQAAMMEAMVREQLNPALGYGKGQPINSVVGL